MKISGNLSNKTFSTGSGRITPKNCLRDYFHLSYPHILDCRSLVVMVLICGFLLYEKSASFLKKDRNILQIYS